MDPDTDRKAMLREMLERLRKDASKKILEFRQDQVQEAEAAPADEMDLARSSADVEMHASLIAREEEKLRFVDEALTRLDAGNYGTCLSCGGPIPLERLEALPFAAYCVDCQQKRNRARRDWGAGTMIEPYDHQWTLPEEMEEPGEPAYRAAGPEEDLAVRLEQPPGRNDTPETAAPVTPRKAAKPRKKPAPRRK